MAQVDRLLGLVGNAALKVPCRVQTTANITLSGEQTVNSVAVVTGDRVLVKDQTDGTENGIYVADTGSWSRSKDFNGTHDVVRGTLVPVYRGAGTYALYAVQNTSVTIGTTSIVFETVDDVALAAQLANNTDTDLGDALVGGKRTETDAQAFTLHDFHQDRPVHIETDFAAAGDGTTLEDTPFARAAATGRVVYLRDKATYYLSTRVSGVTGTRFVCPRGIATIKFKTGTGGFDSTDLTADKDAAARCGFLFDTVDDVGMENIRFTVDATERVIYPIRVKGGTATKGCDFKNLEFDGFSALNGGLLSLNTIGAGSYRVENITGKNCGTALDTWTGTPQITVFEVDNDMVASTPSAPGYFRNIRGIDLELTGAALTAYGQQTDVVNIAGISGTDRKGPTGYGVYGDNVGEVLDLFCSHAVIKGVRGRACYNYGVKLIHGARHNDIECEVIESFGQAAVGLFGSASLAVDTQYNTVRIGNVKLSETIGSFSSVAAVFFGDNGGGAATCLPKNNVVYVGQVVGDSTNLDHVVRDGGADNNNNNYVEVGQASGWATSFCDCVPDNVKVRCKDGTEAHLTLGSAQSITTATPTTVDFSVVAKDVNSEADTANDRVRCKFPGRKLVRAQVRVTGLNSGDVAELRILKNASSVAQDYKVSTGTGQVICAVEKMVYVNENEVSAAGADISIQIEVTSGAGTPVLTQNSALSFFQVTDV